MDQNPVSSPLGRLVYQGKLDLNLGPGHALSLSYGGGAKLFALKDARPADELVQWGRLRWLWRGGEWGTVHLQGNYYDVFQRESLRDFRTGSGLVGLSLNHRASRTVGTAHVGYEGLEYKPIADYSFHGLLLGLSVSRRLTSGRGDAEVEWGLSGGYQMAVRGYQSDVLGPREQCGDGSGPVVCTYAKDARRWDLNHSLRLSADYFGNAVASLWYGLLVNQSNSYGESFVRHMLGLKFTVPLLWGVILTAKGVLQLSTFQDPYLVSETATQTFLSSDDENRSSLTVRLSRDIAKHWSVALRYAVHVNESTSTTSSPSAVPADSVGFLRHLLLLSVRFEYGEHDE
jgi:hypothetical protein